MLKPPSSVVLLGPFACLRTARLPHGPFFPQRQPPICMEGKRGEFRRDIEKCMRLRERWGLARGRFLVCAPELSTEQAAGLSAMYELTFVNLDKLPPHLQQLNQAV